VKRSLSLPRRYLADLVHFARQVPTVPVQRRMHLGAVAAARAVAGPRPSWHALFTKAYALVAQAWPVLRRAFLSFPSAHLYEHPLSVASVALERRCLDEDAVFFAPVRRPEALSLTDLDLQLRRFRDQPLEKIGAFRRCLRFARLPQPVRRWLWWLTLSVRGPKRAQTVGTWAVAAYPSLGAESLHPLSPLTTTLSHGVIAPDGTVAVRLSYDARVLDGPTAARVLEDLERVLTHEILAELRYLEALPEAA
jgi:hypothetical protein